MRLLFVISFFYFLVCCKEPSLGSFLYSLSVEPAQREFSIPPAVLIHCSCICMFHTLHWFPITSRIKHKVTPLITHQRIYGDAQLYLTEILTQRTPTWSSRSAHQDLHHPPRTQLRTMGDRAFCTAAPCLWNSLPVHFRAPDRNDFKKHLKTLLFKKIFNLLKVLFLNFSSRAATITQIINC